MRAKENTANARARLTVALTRYEVASVSAQGNVAFLGNPLEGSRIAKGGSLVSGRWPVAVPERFALPAPGAILGVVWAEEFFPCRARIGLGGTEALGGVVCAVERLAAARLVEMKSPLKGRPWGLGMGSLAVPRRPAIAPRQRKAGGGGYGTGERTKR